MQLQIFIPKLARFKQKASYEWDIHRLQIKIFYNFKVLV